MKENNSKRFSVSYDNYLFWALAVIAPICIKIVINALVNESVAAVLSQMENITDIVELNKRFAESGLGVMSTGIASFFVILIMLWMIKNDDCSGVGGEWYGLHKIAMTHVVVLIVSSVVLSLSINYIVNIIFDSYSEGYTSTEKILFSGALFMRLFVLGIIVPVCEEYIFRGIVFKRLTIQVKPIAAVLISAILFGLYHGNMLQGVYATLMGIILGLLYEKYRNLLAPIIVHAVANMTVIVFESIFVR